MIKELIQKNRSYRRFHQDRSVTMTTLRELVDLGRLAPSGHNRQALKYVLSNTRSLNNQINECLAWAGYLKDWNSPPEGEKPSAFIVMVKDTSVGTSLPQDQGFAAQSILLGAVERGLGGCFLANINRKLLMEILELDGKYSIEGVIAIGYPKEKILLEEIGASGDVRYWRDEEQVHHVPKRSLEEIILSPPN